MNDSGVVYKRYKDFSKQTWCRIAIIQAIVSGKESCLGELVSEKIGNMTAPCSDDQQLLLDHIACEGLIVDELHDEEDERVHIIDKEFLYHLWDLYIVRPKDLMEQISVIAKMKRSWTEVDVFIMSLAELAYIEMEHMSSDERASIIKPYILLYEYYHEDDQHAFLIHTLNSIRVFFDEHAEKDLNLLVN